MPPPGALSKNGTLIKILALSDSYRYIYADLYYIGETTKGPGRSKRLSFILQSNLRYEYEGNTL